MMSRPETTPRASPRPAGRTLRRDIQGLRALAVTVVVLNHLVQAPSGGFFGVDVFLVISGFLITGLLIRELGTTGRISIAEFYRRRARRILPAALLVVLVTVAATYLLVNASRGDAVRTDGIWAVLFAANWHFAAVGTDYWQMDGTVSPLQHYWSLAVEEQFYLLWPWLVVLAGALALGGSGGRVRKPAPLLALFAGSVAAGSLAFALWQSAAQPTWAYFSSLTRGWELAAGALLAVAAPALARLNRRARGALGLAGLILIAFAVLALDKTSGVPAPAALLPVTGTVLLIAAGTGGDAPGTGWLTNRVSQYLGRISYSVYLWHFPVIILLPALLPADGLLFTPAALLLILALSAASFHLVEYPLQHSSLFGRRPGAPPVPRRIRRARALTAMATLTAVVVGAAVLSLRLPGPADSGGAVAAEEPAPAGAGETFRKELEQRIDDAVQAEQFPEFSPDLASLGTTTWVKSVNQDGCAEISAGNTERCRGGAETGSRTVAVLGDSYAIAWMPGVDAAAAELGWETVPLTRGQCPAAGVQVTRNGGEPYPECAAHRDWAMAQILRLRPDVLIIADSDDTLSRLDSGSTGAEAVLEASAGLAATLARLAPAVEEEILVLSPPPGGRSLQDCVTALGSPVDCLTRVNSTWEGMQRAQLNAVAEASGEDAGGAVHASIRYVDTQRWFCDREGRCPGFVGTTPVRVDNSHLTPEYSRSLAPLLADVLGGAGT